MMKVYISGKITGLDLEVARANFQRVETYLAGLGMEVVNPMKLFDNHPPLKWCDYMAKDIEVLLECDAIFMLGNWRDSKGARCELAIATEFGLAIIADHPITKEA